MGTAAVPGPGGQPAGQQLQLGRLEGGAVDDGHAGGSPSTGGHTGPHPRTGGVPARRLSAGPPARPAVPGLGTAGARDLTLRRLSPRLPPV
ncbi:hypothetical protein SAM9427_25620 [Streptomyces sp. ETH9427]|nr:hypothetical protein SAM9427_25620 [Streptomyces sp. ETH9427]